MKVYTTSIVNMSLIKKIFYGYIFRRTEGDVGYVKCSIKQKEKIERYGIELTKAMKLTGKAKEDFEKRLKEAGKYDFMNLYISPPNGYIEQNIDFIQDIWKIFDRFSLSMQWGVLVDWADSIGIYIETVVELGSDKKIMYVIDFYEQDYSGYFTQPIYETISEYTRQEAREKAIEEFNKIYNETRNTNT